MALVALLILLFLAGCASAPPRVVHLTWVKDDVRAPYVERITADTCLIVTGRESVGYAEFGAMLKRCL